MAIFPLFEHATGRYMRNVTGDSFSRAIEAEVKAARSLDKADLRLLGRYGDPTELNLAGATMTNVKMDGCNLMGANLSKANVTGASIKAAEFTMANIKGWTKTSSDTTGTNFMECQGT